MKYNFGIIGLGVMGRNLALNVERNGYHVITYDLNVTQQNIAREIFADKNIYVVQSIEEFLRNLGSPRYILIMVPAGKAVDSVIEQIINFLEAGDVLIDGGNTHFTDTERRLNTLKKYGVLYIGAGISGGEDGALLGPSIMPGGDSEAWPKVKNILQAIAAKTSDGIPCCDWIGNGGAGHFVKMVHNGIEYADMQIICEAYFLMKHLLGLTVSEMKDIFRDWNKGELNSYLIEITAEIMSKNDKETGKPLIDVILDVAGQKGTGKWASWVALDLGIPAQTIAEAVFARTMSALKEERITASEILKGQVIKFTGDKTEYIEHIRQALYASKICAYAQGFQLMQASDREYKWHLNMGGIATLWRAGCIIRAQFLEKITSAYSKNAVLTNLMLDDYFNGIMEKSQNALRKIIVAATVSGIPVPAFSSALSYYDSYRSAHLPANLLQAQRDYFGAHTYERIDKPRGQFFHTRWKED